MMNCSKPMSMRSSPVLFPSPESKVHRLFVVLHTSSGLAVRAESKSFTSHLWLPSSTSICIAIAMHKAGVANVQDATSKLQVQAQSHDARVAPCAT
eukprot:1845299-Amphidinium_carterae.3